MRAFPIAAPEEGLSLINFEGHEVGWVDRVADLPPAPAAGVLTEILVKAGDTVEIGAELLSRRGEDQRLFDERESVKRRRKLDAEYHAAKEAERLTRMASEGYSADKGTSEEGEDD